MRDLTSELLAEMMDAPTPGVRDLPVKKLRTYNAEAARRSRAKKRALREAGKPDSYESDIRQALADAALVILSESGNGADRVRQVLESVFEHKVGVAFTVEVEARRGARKPKLYKAS